MNKNLFLHNLKEEVIIKPNLLSLWPYSEIAKTYHIHQDYKEFYKSRRYIISLISSLASI